MAGWVGRAVAVATLCSGLACASRGPARLHATSTGTGEPLTGEFVGHAVLEGDLVALQLDTVRVDYRGFAAGEPTPLEGVSVRAVVAADSAGHAIPLGVSGTLQVADALQVGERRLLLGVALGIPLPPERRPRELWIAFQLQGTAHRPGRPGSAVVAYVCSAGNLLGTSRTGAAIRARDVEAGGVRACRL